MTSTRTPVRVSGGGGGGGGGGSARRRAQPATPPATATPARRTSPRAKLTLSFSAGKSPGGSATKASPRKPLRVVTNTPPPAPVDTRKILRGVYAMVDVRVGKDAAIDCSDAVAKKLADMGATILKKRGGRLTHVVVSHFTPQWKEKVGKWHSMATPVEVVSQLWVNACFTNKQRMKESAFFPVNKGFEISAPTSARSSSVAPGGALKDLMPSARKRATSTTPARPSSAMGMMTSTGALSLTASPIAFKPSTPTQTSRAANTNARKRRAISMEPMPSDAILRLLEQSTKKLLRQSSDMDVHAALKAVALDSAASTPVKSVPMEATTSTPPLTVRLRATMERRKSFASVTSLSELQQAQSPESSVATGNDCVSDSCSEGEGEDQATKSPSGALLSAQTTVASNSTFASPASLTGPRTSPVPISFNITSPLVHSKGDWACSICNCMNAKTRRLCKGCKASRVAAKTSVTDKSPIKRRVLRSASTTPQRRTLTGKAAALANTAGTPTSQSSAVSSARKTPPVSSKRPAHPLKRPRLSEDTETSSVRSANDMLSDERLVPSTPLAKKQKTSPAPPPTSTKKAPGPPRAIIGITGVDSEARGILECAVHGIDANMASEPGHRKARVVKSVDYAAGVTHLIIGGEVKRTIKVLFAIARGAWIVSDAWAFTSLEQEKWLNEEDFEVEAFPKRHLRLEPEQRQVFRSLKFFVGSKIDPSREVLISLIQCAGGEIVNQISVADYCICGDETLFRRAARTKIHGVVPKWVFDSIASLKLADPSAYGLVNEGKKDQGEDEQKA